MGDIEIKIAAILIGAAIGMGLEYAFGVRWYIAWPACIFGYLMAYYLGRIINEHLLLRREMRRRGGDDQISN